MAFPTSANSVVTDPGGTGSTIVPTLPSGHAVGDVIEIFVGKTGNVAWAAPAGWTIVQQLTIGTSTNGLVATLLQHTVVSGDSLPLASPTCSLGATVTRGAIAFVKRGADVEGVHVLHEWLAQSGATGTANPIRPASTTTRSPENLITHYYAQRTATNAPEPSGYTEVQQIVISGTLVINVSEKNVADQQTVLANQDASPTGGARWAGIISCTPSPDYPYHRSSSSATVASGTQVTPALPTGTTASDVNGRKDLIIATVEASGNAIAIVPNTPADWTEITGFSDNTSGNGTTVRRYWCLFDGSMDRRFNRPTNGELSATLNTYHNCHQTTPIGAVNKRQNASSTTSTWDALTRTATKVAMEATCVADAVPTFTSPATWMERFDGLGISCSVQPFNATGSTASASFTLSTASPTLVGLVEIVGAASSVAATLVIQNASHAHSADNLALTQVHSLVVQDASHSHTAQNVVLTQAHSLVVQDASHSHTAENLALTQTYVLAVQNATHSHTAESLTLTQVHSLAVQNAAHGHTADNLTLTQVHSLSIDSASHGHAAENLSLTQVHSLTAQGATHAHTAENVVLESEGALVIQNAAHGHTSENVSLTQVHQLVVSDSSHAHSAESLTLTQVHQLAIASASHGHSADSLTLTQDHVLAVQSGVHSHSAENVVLAAEGTLGIQNSTHSHTAQNVTLTQVHTLAIQDATHGHTVESPTLTEVYNLTVQSASHSHSAANLALTQTHSLTVSSSTHSHTAQNLGLGNQNNLLISDSFHAHTTSGILFNWVIPEDVYVVQAENTTFTVVDSQIFTVPSEDNIFEV